MTATKECIVRINVIASIKIILIYVNVITYDVELFNSPSQARTMLQVHIESFLVHDGNLRSIKNKTGHFPAIINLTRSSRLVSRALDKKRGSEHGLLHDSSSTNTCMNSV